METFSVDTRATDLAMPYQPGWVNRLIDWIDLLPIHPWVLLGGIWLVFVAVAHIAAWFNGILVSGVMDTRILIVSAWAPYCLGFMGYLNRTASRALDDFRPALDLTDQELLRLRYEFTALPAGRLVIANLLGIVMVGASIIITPETLDPFVATPSLAVVSLSIASTGIVFCMAAIYQTFRQLRLTRQTYTRANRLQLFQGSQLYAFSSLTVRIGIGWLLIIYAGILAFPALLRNPLWAATSGIVVLSCALSFLTTLSDIHHRINIDKTRELDAVNCLLVEVFKTVNQRIQDGQTDDLASLKEAAATLDLERNVVSRLPTWPWQPGTVAGFLTALMLPLLVWLAQMFITRLLEP